MRLEEKRVCVSHTVLEVVLDQISGFVEGDCGKGLGHPVCLARKEKKEYF